MMRCLLFSFIAEVAGAGNGLFMMSSVWSGSDNGQKNVKITGDERELHTDGIMITLYTCIVTNS